LIVADFDDDRIIFTSAFMESWVFLDMHPAVDLTNDLTIVLVNQYKLASQVVRRCRSTGTSSGCGGCRTIPVAVRSSRGDRIRSTEISVLGEDALKRLNVFFQHGLALGFRKGNDEIRRILFSAVECIGP
jgi:hypothetical protein